MLELDVREYDALVQAVEGCDAMVHLAAIVTPGRGSNRQLEWEVDVGGTRNVLEACLDAGVRKLVYTSSGAAYGYHADNPAWIAEDQPLREQCEQSSRGDRDRHDHYIEHCGNDQRQQHGARDVAQRRLGFFDYIGEVLKPDEGEESRANG